MKSVLVDLFKAFVFVFLFIGGIWFYLVFPSDLSIFLVIVNFILTITLVLKWKIQWFLILSGLILVYYLIFNFLPSEPCGSSHIKEGTMTSCECMGIIKTSPILTSDLGIHYDRCIGKRIKCYNYNDSFGQTKSKKEVLCK